MTESPAAEPRVKRAYNRRAPIRSEGVRAVETRPEPVRPEPKRVRVRKGGMGVEKLHIPKHMWPDGVDLQWIVDTIHGQPMYQERMGYEINGWQPVTCDMFQGRFDGMFMPRGHKGPISVEGMILMERPMELTNEARAEERNAAKQAVSVHERKIKSGQIEGATDLADTSHQSARANTRINKEMLSGVNIPRD